VAVKAQNVDLAHPSHCKRLVCPAVTLYVPYVGRLRQQQQQEQELLAAADDEEEEVSARLNFDLNDTRFWGPQSSSRGCRSPPPMCAPSPAAEWRPAPQHQDHQALRPQQQQQRRRSNP
jgi:hypothetical protein